MPEMPLVADLPLWADEEGKALQARLPDWIEVRRGGDTVVFLCTCEARHHIDVPVGTEFSDDVIGVITHNLSPQNDA